MGCTLYKSYLRHRGMKKRRRVGLARLLVILWDDFSLSFLFQATALGLAFDNVVNSADYIIEIDSAIAVVICD